MTLLIIIYGLILVILLLFLAQLSDKVDRLEGQVNQQSFDIGYNRMAIKEIGEEVCKKG